MQSKILTPLTAALICIAQWANANGHACRPVSTFSTKFLNKAIEAYDKIHLASENHGKVGKICSCQVLDLKSSNYDHKHMAVFAEESKRDDLSADFQAAKAAIEKEKKHLKDFFYDQMHVVGTISEETDCRTLYLKLKFADQSLVLYDILNADLKVRK
ncbi:MAG: hypothetical protein ACHQEM_05140 [Chitinophagales bacterium]